jgi:regulator of sirC expression with transglutaminase-like and TPR domain
VDATERFVALVQGSDEHLRLDEAALCIATHAHPALDIEERCAHIDDLAAGCASATFDAVREELFVVHGFRGDTEHYDDPRNSFLDSVLDRRVGIPITLSILVIEVARRLGLAVDPIGMPGHFLVREAVPDAPWCDPFHGGVLLDLDGCRARFDEVFRGTRRLGPLDLLPVPRRAVVARMLANLERGPAAAEPEELAWMCRLHLAIPGLPAAEVQRLERVRAGALARWN